MTDDEKEDVKVAVDGAFDKTVVSSFPFDGIADKDGDDEGDGDGTFDGDAEGEELGVLVG